MLENLLIVLVAAVVVVPVFQRFRWSPVLGYLVSIGEFFGVNANYTYADGETDHTWADGSHNLVGTSKDTYNVGAYFENAMFSARPMIPP